MTRAVARLLRPLCGRGVRGPESLTTSSLFAVDSQTLSTPTPRFGTHHASDHGAKITQPASTESLHGPHVTAVPFSPSLSAQWNPNFTYQQLQQRPSGHPNSQANNRPNRHSKHQKQPANQPQHHRPTMSQVSHTFDRPSSESMATYTSISSALNSSAPRPDDGYGYEKYEKAYDRSTNFFEEPLMPPHCFANGFTNSWYPKSSTVSLSDIIAVLVGCNPASTEDYAEHLFKIASLLYDGEITRDQAQVLAGKYRVLRDMLSKFAASDNPAESRLYKVVEACFDVLIKIATNSQNIDLATVTIRFLTTMMMSLNYWEVYNLLRWRPAFYQFLLLIKFDLYECYARFMRDYQKYTYKQQAMSDEIRIAREQYMAQESRRRQESEGLESSPVSASPSFSPTPSESGQTPSQDYDDERPRRKRESDSNLEIVKEDGSGKGKKLSRERKRTKSNAVDAKLAAHRVIKNSDNAVSSRSSNYDPDVIHECRLPCPDEPEKLCLRRFSRKYELIRHQETVHSKKKKLFKCYVCVKQDPHVGPRIFTRHDTLAKHIRVNHRISGKEAKAEVAYSKKHAEIVDEGDITVHVGRRKTKVDFELRAHMEKQGITTKQLKDGAIVFDDIDDSPPDSIQSADDDEDAYIE